MRAVIKSSRVQRWLIFTVGAAVAPFGLGLFYQWIAGELPPVSVLLKMCAPDILLVSLSVSASLMNIATSKAAWKKGGAAIAGFSIFLCISFYSFLFGRETPPRIYAVFALGVLAFLINSICGICSEFNEDNTHSTT